MPELPEVQEQEAEFAVPAMPAGVPIRENEKPFQAGMNLEDGRRKESIIADLRQQLRELGQDSAQSEIIARSKVGRAERERQRLVRNKVRELQTGGTCLPATVININPVQLELTGQLQDLRIPASGKGAPINLAFRGRTFLGSYVTIATPKVWLKTTGSTSDPTGDRPTMEAKHIPPIGLAHQFYSHYSEGASDAQHMGGIIIFEGDIHSLDKNRLRQTERRVKMPKANWSADDPGEILYTAEYVALDEYLAQELNAQRAYAELVITQGHSYYTSQSEDERKQLSIRHITWHNYALGLGYIEKALPWATDKLKDSPLNQAVYCPDCRTKQEDPEQYFCRNCNAPFDAHKAFLAGKQVSADRLAVYDEKSKEFKDIMGELDRRRKRMAIFDMEPKQGKTKAE